MRLSPFCQAMLMTGLLCLATPGEVRSATIFFGEDLLPGGTVPPAGNAAAARQSFLNSLTGGVSTEDFGLFATGTTAPLALSFTGGLGTINATLTGDGQIRGAPGAGRFATSGTQYWEVSGAFAIDFSTPIAAFGFFGTDIGDFDGQVTIETLNGASQLFTVPNTLNGPDGSLLFYGLIDTANPFTRVVFGNTNPGVDFFGFDSLTVGDISQVSPVPLPSTLLLFGTAMSLALLRVRRRRESAH